MKSLYGIILLSVLMWACAPSSRLVTPPASNVIDLSQNNEDQEEYEVSVFDPGFETWFTTTWNSAKDRSENYYSHWNQMYVSAWNYKVGRPGSARFFENTIQYDPTIEYGMEVERKLYYYFRWVDTQLGIPILDSPPPGAI